MNIKQNTRWFIFNDNDQILLSALTLPTELDSTFELTHAPLLLATHDDITYFAAHVKSAGNTSFTPFREAYYCLNNESLFCLASRAKALLHWDHRTLFCGTCGHPTTKSATEWAKMCAHCNALFYPQISPVILALIWRDDEILLGRSPHFTEGIYSILAGFVEAGETLEETLKREIKEEVNLTVKNIRYISSQAWPFPSNLMVGFTAEYESGEIEVDTRELEDAQWFTLNNLPPLPLSLGLSRRMIDAHVAKRQLSNYNASLKGIQQK